MSKRKTQEEYIKELAIKNPTVKVIGEYINNRTPIIHYCEIHDVYWNTPPNSVLKGCGCKQCCGEKIGSVLRKSKQRYIDELAIKNPTLKLVGEYVNSNTATEHYCEIHKTISLIKPSNALNSNGCWMCGVDNRSNQKRKTQDEYISELSLKNPTVKLVGEYIDSRTPVEHYCEIHNITWNITPYAALRGDGCWKCCNERIGNTLRKSIDQYTEELKEIHPNIILCGEYVNSSTPTLHKCLIHDYKWYPTPGNLLSGSGCPKCKESKGEKKISAWLKQNKITFASQYSFDDCKDKKALPFDFYIESLNICIEYQGEQHYRPVNFGGISNEEAFKNFKITQFHDQIKVEYCKNNGIKLICIPYWEDTEEYLNKNLLI